MIEIWVDEIIEYDTSDIVASYDLSLQPAPKKYYLPYKIVSVIGSYSLPDLVCYRVI